MNPIEAVESLEGYRRELDSLSKELARANQQIEEVTRGLEPLEDSAAELMDDYLVRWFMAHEAGDRKWPSEDVRRTVAWREAVFGELKEQIEGKRALLREPTRRRDRIQQRMKTVDTAISANQSILKALKLEAELA